ncbi:MAG: alginate export family protein [Acidobacteria bacterium]|nr:alginate export family protein [Acidobacteriota bacterium]
MPPRRTRKRERCGTWAAGLAGALRIAAVVVALSGADARLFAQNPPPVEVGGVTLSGSLRTRIESSDWFGDDPSGTYTYPGSIFRVAVGQPKARHDWQLELAIPVVFGLPDQAVVAGAPGALGLGANYFAANDNSARAASLFVKQAFVRVRRLGGVNGQSLKIGRMEFVDGTEVAPKHATLAALKRDRIAHRLLGNFAFTHVGRSVDGVLYALDRPVLNVTVLGARPTQGVFQVDGWGELDVNVFYGAVTGQVGGRENAGEWRFFGLAYRDGRDSVVKTDNRALAIRRADTGTINIGTFGGHYLHVAPTAAGPVDLLLWGAAQTGSWGQLAHRAGAFAAEAGWQPHGTPALSPWIRGGFDYGSGDADPNDATHGTFFQVLPTPRVYARFPFFNMMNTGDAFGELILRPSRTVTMRADVHALRLSDVNDLWYQGGGAFQPLTFGYAGRLSGGHSDLATLADASGDFVVSAHASVAAYFSYAAGQAVTQSIYAGARGARFGYLELSLRF